VKSSVVARNYADALLELGRREQAVERFGQLIDAVAGVVTTDPTVHGVLMSPRVTKAAKARLLTDALKDVAPASFTGFLGAIVRRGRQGDLADISAAYQDAADAHFNRVHASVVTAHAVDESLAAAVAKRLTAAVGKEVLPHFRTDPAIVGGVVVRMGDRVFDGSLRRRIQTLRYRLLHAPGAPRG